MLASESDFHKTTTQFFTLKSEIDDHGVGRGDTGRLLAQLRRPVASWVALDLPYWAMCSAPYCLIRMAIEMSYEAGPFYSVIINFMSCVTLAERS